jgi:hypothetical protein
MKIKDSDFEWLKEKISAKVSEIDFETNGNGIEVAMKKYNWTKNLTRWQIFHSVNKESNYELSKRLYQYLNDKHIETALIKIIP